MAVTETTKLNFDRYITFGEIFSCGGKQRRAKVGFPLPEGKIPAYINNDEQNEFSEPVSTKSKKVITGPEDFKEGVCDLVIHELLKYSKSIATPGHSPSIEDFVKKFSAKDGLALVKDYLAQIEATMTWLQDEGAEIPEYYQGVRSHLLTLKENTF